MQPIVSSNGFWEDYWAERCLSDFWDVGWIFVGEQGRDLLGSCSLDVQQAVLFVTL